MILMINSIITIEIVPDHNLGINTLSVLGSETLLASNLFLKKNNELKYVLSLLRVIQLRP